MSENEAVSMLRHAIKQNHKFVVCIEAEEPKCSITISHGYEDNIATALALEKFARNQRNG